jgi:hypothetical protein
MQAQFDGAAGSFFVLVQRNSSACVVGNGPALEAEDIEVAVLTVMLDAAGVHLNETFYPYYGSTVMRTFVPGMESTFQSEFQPYALISTSPRQALEFAPGYPSAVNITSTSFVLTLRMNQAISSTEFAIFDSSRLDALPALNSSEVMAQVFAGLQTTYSNVTVIRGALTTGLGQMPARLNSSQVQAARELSVPISTGLVGNGGNRTVLIAVKSGCTTAYALLENILQPDTEAPTFIAVSVQSSCMNLAADSSASYQVQVQLSEAADVWLVGYRNFPALSPSSTVQPGVVTKRAPNLDIPACSSASVAATVDAFKPCTPIAYVQSRTSDNRLNLKPSKARHISTFIVSATVRPGLAALRNMEAACQYKHLFGLSSSTADFHLVARDVQPTFKQFQDSCSMGPASKLDKHMWQKHCRFVSPPRTCPCLCRQNALWCTMKC